MERVNPQLAQTLRASLTHNRDENGTYHLPASISAEALLRLTQEVLGEEFVYVHDASDLVWQIARHQGYIIPANPVEARGDAKTFLAEEGVRNAHEWYEKRGFKDEAIRNLYTTNALMVRNENFWRKIIAISKLAGANASKLAPYLVSAIDFCLGDATPEGDPSVFQC